MSRALLVGVVALLGAGGGAPPPPAAHPLLPWLANLQGVRATDAIDEVVGAELSTYGAPTPACEIEPGDGLMLTADFAPAAGTETILASYAYGVVVLGRERQLLAQTPGFPCAGTADTVEVLATGSAFGVPTIVLVATTGGHAETLSWLAMYRMGPDRRLDTVFTTAIEHRVDDTIRTGHVTVLPGALIVRDVAGGVGVWLYDATAGTYVPTGGHRDHISSGPGPDQEAS